jgi:hypothetical protein
VTDRPLPLPVLAETGGDRAGRDRLELLTALIGSPSFDPLYQAEVICIPRDHPVYPWGCVVEDCVREDLSRLGYRRAEVDGIPRETSQLLTKVFAVLRADGVKPTDIANDLSLTVEEVNKHVFGLVLTVLYGGSKLSPSARPDLHLVED